VTFAQRGKEEASDYRYFPDPDLAPMTVGAAERDSIRRGLCELPAARRERFLSVRGLSPYDATVIVDQGRGLADYFERVADLCGDAKQAANWVTQDVLRELNDRRSSIGDFPIAADVLGTILARIGSAAITVKSGRELFAELLRRHDEDESSGSTDIDVLIDERGLRLVRTAACWTRRSMPPFRPARRQWPIIGPANSRRWARSSARSCAKFAAPMPRWSASA
jgi:aspartyl-tRNA(Asn)/glutamyl-tRNA(Gln) amidotransferase subunit B